MTDTLEMERRQRYEERLQQIKDEMGTQWVGHPQYTPTPKHAWSIATWMPHATLTPIIAAAKAAGRI